MAATLEESRVTEERPSDRAARMIRFIERRTCPGSRHLALPRPASPVACAGASGDKAAEILKDRQQSAYDVAYRPPPHCCAALGVIECLNPQALPAAFFQPSSIHQPVRQHRPHACAFGNWCARPPGPESSWCGRPPVSAKRPPWRSAVPCCRKVVSTRYG